MRRLVLGLAAFVLVGAGTALAFDAAVIIRDAPDPDRYPEADIVVLRHDETIEVDAEGRVTHRVHSLRRLQTQWAVRRHSDSRLAWHRDRQDLEVLVARTHRLDGTLVPTPSNGTNEVTHDAVARAVPFLDLRELVVSHVGTEPGCVVELAYVRRDRDAGPLPPGGVCWLGANDPVVAANVHLEGVAGALVGFDLSRSDSTGTGRWTARELPSFADVAAGQRRRVVPHVVWSTSLDVDALGAAVKQAGAEALGCGRRLVGWSERMHHDQAVLTDADFVGKVAAMIHDEIAGVRLPEGTWSRAPRDAETVFSTSVGTDWERALVAVAILRRAGFAPELGLFSRTALIEAQPVDPVRFERLRVVVRVGNDNWWLAPDRATAWSGSSDLPGWTGVFLAADGDRRVYTAPTPAHDARWVVRVAPETEGWQALADLEMTAPRHRGATPEDVAASLAGKLLVDGEITDTTVRHETETRLAMRLEAQGTDPAAATDGLVGYVLPWPDGTIVDALEVDLDRRARRAPFWIDQGGTLAVDFAIELPAGWSLDHPRPGTRQMTSKLVNVTATCAQDAQTVHQTMVVEVKAGRVDPADWAALRDAVATVQRMRTQPTVLLVP